MNDVCAPTKKGFVAPGPRISRALVIFTPLSRNLTHPRTVQQFHRRHGLRPVRREEDRRRFSPLQLGQDLSSIRPQSRRLRRCGKGGRFPRGGVDGGPPRDGRPFAGRGRRAPPRPESEFETTLAFSGSVAAPTPAGRRTTGRDDGPSLTPAASTPSIAAAPGVQVMIYSLQFPRGRVNRDVGADPLDGDYHEGRQDVAGLEAPTTGIGGGRARRVASAPTSRW
jgi:hypothetical protein